MRNLVFGVEDSLVSTVGLVSGIAVAGIPEKDILITGAILITVEAFSMGAGSFLSEYSVEEYMDRQKAPFHRSILGALTMFCSYFASGFVPLFPYKFFSLDTAFPVSVVGSLVGLALLGIFSARRFKVSFWSSVLRMVLVGGIAIAVGVFVGGLLK